MNDESQQHPSEIKAPSPPELSTFTFRLRGHNQDLPAVVVRAETEQKAFREAFKSCRSFELPGWHLYCMETGTAQEVVRFVDGSKKSELGIADRVRR